MSLKLQPVSVFGVPTDVGAGTRGASMGPETLRVAGFVEALAARGVDDGQAAMPEHDLVGHLPRLEVVGPLVIRPAVGDGMEHGMDRRRGRRRILGNPAGYSAHFAACCTVAVPSWLACGWVAGGHSSNEL